MIGGTACNLNLRDTDTEPRDTVDIDIILVSGNINAEFGRKFWKFIEDGRYQNRTRKRGEGKEPVPELFRFLRPQTPGFPQQIEILSVQPDILGEPSGFYLTPIPFDEDVPSLSAIIMDKEYYDFTLLHRIVKDGISVADLPSLICLKATAFVNLSHQRTEAKNSVQSHDIRKHRDDVFKLLSVIDAAHAVELPKCIKQNVNTFVEMIESEINNREFLVSMKKVLGLNKESIEMYIDILKDLFQL